MISEKELKTKIGGTDNFYWYEALLLPQWEIYAIPTNPQIKKIEKIALALQEIRNMLGKPIRITSWFRPPKYNVHIGGARQSMHMTGGAVDFQCSGVSCDEIRAMLKPELARMKIRMEDLPFSRWVHIDIKPVKEGGRRFFKP